MSWIKALGYAKLKQQGRAIFRHQGRQLALFLSAQGEVLACNNRCPHEGYPLSEGHLDEQTENACVLTCNWHNWKFDLHSGDNLYGGDRLRIYPTELRGDDIWIDFSEPTPEQQQAETLANLQSAMADNDYTRIARELGRFRLLGADPRRALNKAIIDSYEQLEFGWTHAYAGAADWLLLYQDYDGDPETQLICLLESLGHIADDTLREAHYPYNEQRQPYEEERFIQAIDAEDEPLSIAMLQQALDEGLHFMDLEQALSRAALLHYNDFGHSLIYVVKAGNLIQHLGDEVERPLLLALVRSLIFATREDQIPDFRTYQPTLQSWGKLQDMPIPQTTDYRPLSIKRALERTAQSSHVPPEALFEVLLAANAQHMLAYDLSYQSHINRSIVDNVGWLSFTHGVTFANAVRRQCNKFPELWPAGLLQMACFSGRNKPYTDYQSFDEAWDQWHVKDHELFFRDQIEALFDHAQTEFIVSVHLLKTLLAAREEVLASEDAMVRQTILAALNRFLHSPLKRKHVRRTMRQAMKFVARDST